MYLEKSKNWKVLYIKRQGALNWRNYISQKPRIDAEHIRQILNNFEDGKDIHMKQDQV